MEDYKSMCKQIQDKVKQITEGRGFFARYGLTIDEPIREGAREVTTVNLSVDFFDDVFKVAGKLRELLDKDETNASQVERQDGYSIKSARDEALMNLYKHYNRLTALEEVDYATSESMHILIDAIEKLEHARHMDASDEIAKMAFEKLEKFARPIPEIKMDVKQFEEIAKDHYGKKGAKE